MNRRTIALQITPATKRIVFARDGGCCILCGRAGNPNAHYISRGQSGKGIAQNIVTLCHDCHRRYDQTAERALIRPHIREHLQAKYPDWDETKLTYNKWED